MECKVAFAVTLATHTHTHPPPTHTHTHTHHLPTVSIQSEMNIRGGGESDNIAYTVSRTVTKTSVPEGLFLTMACKDLRSANKLND